MSNYEGKPNQEFIDWANKNIPALPPSYGPMPTNPNQNERGEIIEWCNGCSTERAVKGKLCNTCALSSRDKTIAEKDAEIADNERWQKEVLTDFRILFDDHKTGIRLAITQWMKEQKEEIERLKALDKVTVESYMMKQQELQNQITQLEKQLFDLCNECGICVCPPNCHDEMCASCITDKRYFKEELTTKREALEKCVHAAWRLAHYTYSDWSVSGGPNPCDHGIAMGIHCKRCDTKTIDSIYLTLANEELKKGQRE